MNGWRKQVTGKAKCLLALCLLIGAIRVCAQGKASDPDPIESAELMATADYSISAERIRRRLENSRVFPLHFTGFSLYDLTQDQWVTDVYGEKHFQPASNVKLLTAFAILKTFDLEDRVPCFAYRETSQYIALYPFGDPSFLHPGFERQPAFDWLKAKNKPIRIAYPDLELPKYGIGWMWDDYESPYQPELSWLPIYANQARFAYDRTELTAEPIFFEELSAIESVTDTRYSKMTRNEEQNWFTAEIGSWNRKFKSKSVPFIYSPELMSKLLGDTLGVSVRLENRRSTYTDTIYSVPVKSALEVMLKWSDNFIAEQMLIQCMRMHGFEDGAEFRYHVIEKWMKPMIAPQWYDASGMSRYNLITPNDLVRLLTYFYTNYGWELWSRVLPAGGESGTLSNWYANTSPYDEQVSFEPYVFAKTGTLKNNHSLSGYLKGNSGRMYAFSFIHNNYTVKGKVLREEMEVFLESLRDDL